jgi:hypothetical protein
MQKKIFTFFGKIKRCNNTECPQKRRRVHNSVIYRKMVNCQNIFFEMGLHIFFSNSDRDFYSENNNVSQVYT